MAARWWLGIGGVAVIAAGAAWQFGVAERVEFSQASDIDTPAAYELFLRNHPDGQYADEARTRRDDARKRVEAAAYSRAKASGTVVALEEFARAYGASPFAPEALVLAEQRAFDWMQQSRSLSQLSKFKTKYPNSRFKAKLAQLEDDWSFADASAQASVASVERYLERFGKRAIHAARARELLESWAFDALKTTREFDAISKFKERFPQSRHLAKLDDLAFSVAEQQRSESAYQRYRDMFAENGRHRGVALERAEALAFKALEASPSLAAFSQFLQRYPRGVNATAVRAQAARIWDEKIAAYKKSAPENGVSRRAYDFMLVFLTYLRDTGATSIDVQLRRRMKLREWMELPIGKTARIKDSLPPAERQNFWPESVKEEVEEMGLETFDKEFMRNLENVFAEGLGEGVVQFRQVQKIDNGAQHPSWVAEYVLQTQYKDRYPVIYRLSRGGALLGHRIGMEIAADIKLRVPGTQATYRIRASSEPRGVMQREYRKMIAGIMRGLAWKMSAALGFRRAGLN